MRARFAFAFAFAFAFVIACAAAAQEAPGLPFSPSSGGGLTASSLTGIFCKITGGADCQMTGQVRLQAGGTAPQLTWHGNDGFGTASDFGISKVGNAVEIRANRATHNASIGMDSLVLRGQQTAGAPQNFLNCTDGAAGDACTILSGTAGGTSSYVAVDARIRNVDGSVAAPAYAFTSETSSGLYRSAASTVAMAIGGTAETLWTATAFSPATSGGNALGTTALPWSALLTSAGTAAAPSWTWGADPNTGLYNAAADQIGFAANGAAEALLSATAFTPGASGGNALGTAALPWAGLLTTDGTAAAPAVSFGADTNTGLYRVGTDAVGVATGGGLALQLGGGSAGQEQRVIAANDTTGSGGLARGFLHLPRSVGATVVSAPGCSAGSEGAMWFVDDTNDSKPGLLCLCTRRSDNTTVEWVNVSLTAGAAAIATGCTP